MNMSNDEILRSFKSAAKPREQVAILAQLNGCSEDKIRAILSEAGVDGRQMPRVKTAPRKDLNRKGGSGTILTVMKEEEKRLTALKADLPERIRLLQKELDELDSKLEALRKAMELIGGAFG